MSPDQTIFESMMAREDLAQYKPNRIAMLALELRFGLDDLRTVADDALTDDEKDHKCDLLYIDRENGTAVIAQAYEADDLDKPEPPSNKASDLNTALSWVLDGEVPHEELGEKLKAAANELRDALKDGDIPVVEIWFIHNLAESTNVMKELRQVEQTGAGLLKHHFSDQADLIEVRALQVGRERLEAWYRNTNTAILVSDDFEVPAKSAWFEQAGTGWSAVCTSVSAAWLRELHTKYGDELFSANVRGPIPSRRSRNNITTLQPERRYGGNWSPSRKSATPRSSLGWSACEPCNSPDDPPMSLNVSGPEARRFGCGRQMSSSRPTIYRLAATSGPRIA
jgi:hypothetical protein